MKTLSMSPMIACGRLQLLAAVSAGALASATAAAATIELRISPLNLRPRSEAVRMVDLELKVRGASLAEGRLELESKLMGTAVRTRELILPPGTMTLRTLLPGGFSSSRGMEEVNARFLDRNGKAVSLGAHPVNGIETNARVGTIGVCAPDTFPTELRTALWQAFRLEPLVPANWPQAFVVAPLFFSTEELPNDPLALCTCDVLLLVDVDFATLREKQVTALQQWVAAGGSLCIASHTSIAPEPFTRTFGLSGAPLPETLTGLIEVPDAEIPSLYDAGFGRVVLLENAGGITAPPSKNRFAAIAHLWRLNRQASAEVVAQGKWSVKRSFAADMIDHDLTWPGAVSQISSTLLTDLRVVPWSWITLVIVGFVLLVGPIDYFLLRFWRKPVWTWVLFPAASAACTLYLVWLPEHYLDAFDERRSIIVDDIGPGGNVVRETRFQLEFAARDLIRTVELRNVLCTPLRTDGDVLYEGQFPAQYRLNIPLRKWSPTIIRTTSLSPGPDRSGLDWGEVGRLLDRSQDPGPSLRARGAVAAYVDEGEGFRPLIHGPLAIFGAVTAGRRTMGGRDVFTSIAPHGGLGQGLRDLAIADVTDPSQRTLIVVQQSGRDFRVSRRVWHR